MLCVFLPRVWKCSCRVCLRLSTHLHEIIVLQRWTETYVRWSPQGSYLATFHQKGIALWGGEKFSQIQRFSHPGVQLIDFSPCERCALRNSISILKIVTANLKDTSRQCKSLPTQEINAWKRKVGKLFGRMVEKECNTPHIYWFYAEKNLPNSVVLNQRQDKAVSPADTLWRSALSRTARMTLRPSLSGTSAPAKRNAASTAKTPPSGPSSSQYFKSLFCRCLLTFACCKLVLAWSLLPIASNCWYRTFPLLSVTLLVFAYFIQLISGGTTMDVTLRGCPLKHSACTKHRWVKTVLLRLMCDHN